MEDHDSLAPQDITIHFRYTFEEYIDAYRLHYSQLRRLKRNIIFSVALLFLGVGLCLFLGYSFSNSLPIYASVILAAFLLSEYFLSPSKSFERDPRLKEERTLTFSEEKIIFKIGKDMISVKWKQYSHFLENSEFYLFYYAPETFLILPKRAFTLEGNERFKKMVDLKFAEVGIGAEHTA